MRFSIVIPLAPYRDAEIIDSIKKLDYPVSEFHVVVIKGRNPSENRNRGASKARGEIIGFLDDDAIIEKDFLNKVDEFFKKHPEIDIVGGPQLTPKDEKGFAKTSGYALASKFGAADTISRYIEGKLNLNADEKSITSANLFVKREIMEKVKFDVNLWPGEDPKFISDAKKLNLRVAYSPDFTLFHRRRPTLKGLIKQNFNFGKVRPAKESFRETLKNPTFLVPSFFVLYLIFVLFMSIILTNNILSMPYLLIFLPLALYSLLDLMFSFLESIKNKDYRAVFLLLFIYPIIHISYGLGMISGWLRKIFRK